MPKKKTETEESKATVVIRLDADLKNKIQQLAESQERSLNQQISFLLKEYFREHHI